MTSVYTVCTRCGQHMPEPRRVVVTGLDEGGGRVCEPSLTPYPCQRRSATGFRRTRYPPARLCSASHFLPVNRATSLLSLRKSLRHRAISDAQSPPTFRWPTFSYLGTPKLRLSDFGADSDTEPDSRSHLVVGGARSTPAEARSMSGFPFGKADTP